MISNEQQLAGKVALVTGASKGIGAAIAKHLAAAGAQVIVNYTTSQSAAEQVVAEITARGGKATAIRADITKKTEVVQLFNAIASFGTLDILVNNAGSYEFCALEDITEEHFYRLFNLNVFGLLSCSQEALNYFAPAGGCIINISSIASLVPSPNTSVYSATKAAVDSITRTLSLELAGRNIRVNAINPGMVASEGVQEAGLLQGDFRERMQTPLGSIGRPEDLAPMVTFLASSDAAWISGENIKISGGLG